MDAAGARRGGRPFTGAAIGVVPVCSDDPDAPSGCAALRELRGTTLLIRSLDALLRSGLFGQIRIAVPPDLAPVVEHLVDVVPLPGPGGDAVRVTPVPEQGHGHRVRAVLAGPDVPADRPVVVHDPLYPLVPVDLMRLVLDVLLAHVHRLVAAVPVRPVTDTVKWVDGNGVVLGTADRDHFRTVHSPQAYWPGGLLAALGAASPERLRDCGPAVLPRLFQDVGGQLLDVPAPGDLRRVSTPEDVVLADAMLHVVDGVTGQGIR